MTRTRREPATICTAAYGARRTTHYATGDDNQSVGSSGPMVSRWLWPGNTTFWEVASMVVTWCIVFWGFFVQCTQHKKASNHHANLPWKCTVLHCNHLENTWKPLVLMTQHFDYCPSARKGDNQSVRSSAPVFSMCFPGGYNVKVYISRGRLAWWLLAFSHSGNIWIWQMKRQNESYKKILRWRMSEKMKKDASKTSSYMYLKLLGCQYSTKLMNVIMYTWWKSHPTPTLSGTLSTVICHFDLNTRLRN